MPLPLGPLKTSISRAGLHGCVGRAMHGFGAPSSAADPRRVGETEPQQSLSCKLRLKGSGGWQPPPPSPRGGPSPHPPPPPHPTRNPCAIYNNWARFGGSKIQYIVGFARCKGWRARGVPFFACQNAPVPHFRSAALGLAALHCATCGLQPCSLQPYSLQPATLQPADSQLAALLLPCSPQLATLHALAWPCPT